MKKRSRILKKDIKSKNFEKILDMKLWRKDFHIIKTSRGIFVTISFFEIHTHTKKLFLKEIYIQKMVILNKSSGHNNHEKMYAC